MGRISLAQMTSTPDFEKNLQTALRFIDEAVEDKSDLVAFPENFLLLGNKEQYVNAAEFIPGPMVELFQNTARKKNISILMGSLFEKSDFFPEKIHNTSVLIDRNGEIRATYRKIHLFDVSLPNVHLVESELVAPGKEIVNREHEIGHIGLTICYDLRFPTLYQRLTARGAEIIFVPAAFTVPTGRDHWLNLLRTRAIENQVFIAAPAQFGKHSQTRESFGKSVLIDPWGEIIALAEDSEQLITGEIDMDLLNGIRKRMPIMSHRVDGIDK